jgi:hypothetical protein
MKPCCKVCKDAGKTDLAHWPKDKEGVTICPTLLSQNCRYCHKQGHTVKYCQVLANNKKQEEKQSRRIQNREKKDVKKADSNPGPKKNIFDNLDSDLEEGEIKEEKPIDSVPVSAWTQSGKPSFKDILSRPKEQPIQQVEQVQVAKLEEGYEVLVTSEQMDKRKAREIHNHNCFHRINGLCWADAIDSDDEDEYE